jgi:hypothetical protein
MGLLAFLFGCDSKGDYAKKKGEWYYKDVAVGTTDVRGFTPLSATFARDGACGYYRDLQITDSDGATFTALSNHYAKDRANAFYLDIVPREGTETEARLIAIRIPDAQVASFVELDAGYAKDAGQAYHRGRVIARAPAMFEVLSRGYAKSATQVFYEGALIPNADAPTFAMLEIAADGPSAEDRGATYREAKRTPRP